MPLSCILYQSNLMMILCRYYEYPYSIFVNIRLSDYKLMFNFRNKIRQTGKTDRQTDRRKDIHTDRQQTDIHKYRQTDGQTDTLTDNHTEGKTHIHTYIQSQTNKHTDTTD